MCGLDAVQSQISNIVGADTEALSRAHAALDFAPEEGRTDDTYESEHDAKMDYIAAITAVVLRDQVDQCARRRFMHKVTARANAATEFDDDAAERERCQRHRGQHVPLSQAHRQHYD